MHSVPEKPTYYPPGRDKFLLSLVGPSPVMWCVKCNTYCPITNPGDLAEQRQAKIGHTCHERVNGWL
jgi:hypothetical protein